MQKEQSHSNENNTTAKGSNVSAKLKEKWSKLTETDLALYEGKREQFVAKLKEHYGLAKEEAEQKIKAIEETCRTTKAA